MLPTSPLSVNVICSSVSCLSGDQFQGSHLSNNAKVIWCMLQEIFREIGFEKSNSRPVAPCLLHDFSILNCYLKCFSPSPPEVGYEGELGLEDINPWPRRNDNKKTILANLSLQSHKAKEFSNIPEYWATLCMQGTLLCSHLKKQPSVHCSGLLILDIVLLSGWGGLWCLGTFFLDSLHFY